MSNANHAGIRDTRPRFDPSPLRSRITRYGTTYAEIADRTPWTRETVGALLRCAPDSTGRRTEGLTWWQADRLAVALGCHPTELWDDWHDEEQSA